MATDYLAAREAAGTQPIYNATGNTVVMSTYDVGSGSAFIINDRVKICDVPANVWITNVVVDVPSLDTSTGLVWAVGDGTTAGKFITGATTGRSSAGGIVGMNASGALGAQYAVQTTIWFKVTTAATGTAATTGVINFKVEYTAQQAQF